MPKEILPVPLTWSGNLGFDTVRGPMTAPHRHDELELNWVVAGRASYLLGDRRYDLARNTLVWLFPEQDHILLDRSPDHAMWVCVFRPALLGPLTTEAAVLREPAPAGHYCRRLAEAEAARLSALTMAVSDSCADTPRFNAGLGFLLLSAWAAYQAAAETASGPDVHPAVELAARLLRDDPEPLTLNQLAARTGLSASYLGRLFHAQTGVTLADFRNRQRIERFVRLYGNGTRRTALDAALEAGFGSYAQFHRIWTSLRGGSPASYRRSLKTAQVPGRKPEAAGMSG